MIRDPFPRNFPQRIKFPSTRPRRTNAHGHLSYKRRVAPSLTSPHTHTFIRRLNTERTNGLDDNTSMGEYRSMQIVDLPLGILQISIPSELIGSIPRTDRLIEARLQFESDLLPVADLRVIEKEAIEQTVKELDQLTGSPVVTDGEQTKPSFLTYPIYDLVYERYKFDDKCFRITFSDGQSFFSPLVHRCRCCACSGHVRTLPRLVKAPFQYATYAYKYLEVAKRLTKKPIKQAIITASALSMVYSPGLVQGYNIENYSREQFLRDLVNECEKDIRLCLGKVFCLCETFVEETCVITSVQRRALMSFKWISPRRDSRSKSIRQVNCSRNSSASTIEFSIDSMPTSRSVSVFTFVPEAIVTVT